MLTAVDLDAARTSQRPCLALLRNVPSPWSQAAKALFELERIDADVLWFDANDAAVSAWTGMPNGPVVMMPGEPPRAHWLDILSLAERLAAAPHLLPSAIEPRVRMLGLSHELMGQGGLMWNARLMTIEISLATDGKRGFPRPVAQYLGKRYGYVPGCGDAARKAVITALATFDAQLAANAARGPYYFGDQLTALDVYSTAVMDTFVPLPHEQCPMHPRIRDAFTAQGEEVRDQLPAPLLAHRDLMHARHMPLPVRMG